MSKRIKIDLGIGACQDVLKSYEDNSIDSVICDPPYGLGQEPDPVELMRSWIQEEDIEVAGGGFMGRKWDSTVPSPAVFREILRVLKPGKKSAFFAGTRTLHLMMASLRIAGFEILDVWAWIYGCYSSDTEILTPEGWRSGIDIEEGDEVAAWDSETEEIRFEPVQRKIAAPYKGDMIRFKNANTDQLLTPNHRVYAKHRHRKVVGGVWEIFFDQEWKVKEAGEINRWNTLNLPLAGYHKGPGIGGVSLATLLGWIWTEGGYDTTGNGVRIYQSSVNQQHVEDIRDLLDRMKLPYKEYRRERTYRKHQYTEHTWFISGETALRLREMMPDKCPTWSLLWQMSQEEKRAFFDAAMKGDGCATNGSMAFYQKDPEALEKMQVLAHVIGMQGRINEKNISVNLRNHSKTQLQTRHLKSYYKKPYDGKVWCVTVATGAVVVRRKGKIFISGNSGFPKSHNIHKALLKKIEERYGEARCLCLGDAYVYDESLYDEGAFLDLERELPRKIVLDDYGENDLVTRVCSWCGQPDQGFIDSTEGLGTSLKPAYEPVVVCAKRLKPVAVEIPEMLRGYGFTDRDIEKIMTPYGEGDEE